jgi:hypothetical protein
VARPLLAHYTSVEVLEKMLRSDEMWLANPLHMNDREELQYGMNTGAAQFRINEAIMEACESEEAHRKLVTFFDRLFYEFDSKHAIDTYVLCLSEHLHDNDDGLLSMWRGYGAQGSGVAVVFDLSKLNSIEQSPLLIGKVEYASHPARLDWIDSKLLQVAELLKQHPKTDENLFSIAHAWIERLKLFALFSKHIGFSEENEWRVVYMSERDPEGKLRSMLGYNVTSRGVEPKLKLRLSSVPGVMDESASLSNLVDRIILGPSISTVLAANSVQKMLELAGKPELAERVVASSIPYRHR